MKKWQLQDAKAKFSELVKQAIAGNPQVVTLHGEPVVVVLSKMEYRKLTKPDTSLVDFFQNSPLRGINLDIKRDKSTNRDIEL
jgi:antitoxin Phd